MLLLTLFAMPETVETKFEVHDPEAWHALVAKDAELEKLAGGFKFVEGPTWTGAGGFVFSDIPNRTLHRLRDGEVSVFVGKPGNGNTLALGGRELYRAGDADRTVNVADVETGEDRVLVETFELDGRPVKFNSPNDLVVRSDGTIFFTDPYWGLPGDRREELMEYGKDQCWVFKLKDGVVTPLLKDFTRPNGLAFSPDETVLYVGDDAEKHVRKFDVAPDGDLSGGAVFCKIEPGVPDGMRVDTDGNLWCTAGDGVQVFGPDGKLIGKVLTPESPANCELGNGKLYMTAKTSIYAIDVKATGATASRAD